MATTKKLLKQYGISDAMAKRLAQLAANNGHQHGTSMAALKARGLAEDGDPKTEAIGYGQMRTVHLPCCRLTEEGRKVIEGLRAAGW